MAAYCFPSTAELERNIADQGNSSLITFKSRGLNDNALEYLLNSCLKDKRDLVIDLSYNALTEKSVPLIEKLKQEKNFKFKLEHNYIQYQNVALPSIQTTIMVSGTPPPKLEQLSQHLDDLTDDVDKLILQNRKMADVLKSHSNFIKKMPDILEKEVLQAVLSETDFDELTTKTQNYVADTLKLQVDVLLISPDGLTIIIW